MRILLCSYTFLSREYGAARVLLELADGLTKVGCTCTVVGPEEMAAALPTSVPKSPSEYAQLLRSFLRRRAAEFDVVDYPYDSLPFPRSDFAVRTLFVARSVLLAHHFAGLRIPEAILLRQRIKRFVTGALRRQRQAFEHQIESAGLTLANADLVNVANEDDQTVLAAAGVDPQKIAVVAYGLNDEEKRTLETLNERPPAIPKVCFLGSFDDRKGGADLPLLLAEVRRQIPGCQLRLIGTYGFHTTREKVLACFPRELRSAVEVIPRFRRDELPGWLEGCSVGVFPSYVEGFGLAVLEMMMAGMPVVAYRSPGPPMMLPDTCLTPRGDVAAMAARVLGWLGDEPGRQRAAAEARQRARDFSWDAVATETAAVYRRASRSVFAAP